MINLLTKLCIISLLSISINTNESSYMLDTSCEDDGSTMICSLGEDYNLEDPISVIVDLNYSIPSLNLKPVLNSLEDAQEYISEIRTYNKEYYTEINFLALEKLECSDLSFRCSSYSPFLFCEFDNYGEYANYINTLESISKDDIVKNVYVEPSLVPSIECSVNANESLTLVPIADAKNMIGVDSTSYTGNGLKIGIMDGGIPYYNNFVGGQIKATFGSSFSDHATKVASIIGGAYGIAPEADLYIFECAPNANNNGTYSLFNAVEWLIDNNVNLINMSQWTLQSGFYDGYSAYIDYIVSHNAVSFVKSAGNQATTKLITSPGMGLNVFAVGSIDGDKNLSYYSSYSVNAAYSNIIMKPTLVAPGENIIIPNTINSTLNDEGDGFDIYYSGTSFAAPMVTGCLALLMEQFPQLIVSPELAMSAIVNGAKKLPSQTTLWDNNCGAGLLNYPETVSVLSDGYILGNVPNGASSGFLAGSRSFVVPAKSYVDLSFIHTINSNVTAPYTSTAPLAFSKYSIVVTDSNGLTVTTSSNNSNLNLITISNTDSVAKTMTASIYLNGSKVESGTEYSALTFFTHNHTFTHHFVNYSLSKHKSYCECGEYVLSLHSPDIINTYISNGHIYAPCVFCGALMDLGGNGPIVPGQSFSGETNG